MAARTIQEIYDAMVTQKNVAETPALDDLNSTSATAKWRLFLI